MTAEDVEKKIPFYSRDLVFRIQETIDVFEKETKTTVLKIDFKVAKAIDVGLMVDVDKSFR